MLPWAVSHLLLLLLPLLNFLQLDHLILLRHTYQDYIEGLYKLTECLKANQILRIKNFSSKLEILTELNKIDSQNSQSKLFGVSAFGYENKKSIHSMC